MDLIKMIKMNKMSGSKIIQEINGKPLYKVLINGKSCHGGDLEVLCRSVRLVEKMPKPAYIVNVENFIESLKEMQWCKPDGKPLPEWRLFEATTLKEAFAAAGAAAGAATRAAAWGAAWGATVLLGLLLGVLLGMLLGLLLRMLLGMLR